MANLLHTKGTRTQIYKTLPSNSVGNDGDIILSQIQGKGVYLCSKVNGRWHVSTKMEELRKIEKTSIKDLKLDRVRVSNTTITKDEYDVSSGDFTLNVAGDIELNADSGQITIKDDTATHFLFDCDSTRFRIYDDANENDFFTITIGAEGATTISTIDADTTAGHLTLDADGSIDLDAANIGLINLKNAGTLYGTFSVHHSASWLELYENGGASTSDSFKIATYANAATVISTTDGAGADAHLTLNADGNTVISIDDANEDGGAFHITPAGATNRAFSMWGEVDNYTTFQMYERGGASTSDYFKIETGEHGATTISTVDGASDNADLTIAPDGKLLISSNTYLTAGRRFFFDGASGHSYISEDSADLLNFQVGGVNLMAIAEDATTSAAQSSKIFTGCPIYLRDIGGVSDTPPSNYGSLYINSDVLYFKTDGGTVTNLLSGGGGGLNSIVAAMVFG